jgi:DNA polymerase III epsilon subunit-like protein
MTTRTYSRYHPGKYGLAIDWETTGSNFGGDSTVDYQGIAFGAVIFDTTTFEPVQTLYRELHFDASKYKWTEGAEKIHGLSQEHLALHGVPREEALADLLELIAEFIGTESKILFLGHNVDFDIDFTDQLARDFGIPLKIHHVKIDTSGMSFAVIGEYKSDKVFAFFEGEERAKQHNALDDCMMALNVVKTIRALVQESLQPVTS